MNCRVRTVRILLLPCTALYKGSLLIPSLLRAAATCSTSFTGSLHAALLHRLILEDVGLLCERKFFMYRPQTLTICTFPNTHIVVELVLFVDIVWRYLLVLLFNYDVFLRNKVCTLACRLTTLRGIFRLS